MLLLAMSNLKADRWYRSNILCKSECDPNPGHTNQWWSKRSFLRLCILREGFDQTTQSEMKRVNNTEMNVQKSEIKQTTER